MLSGWCNVETAPQCLSGTALQLGQRSHVYVDVAEIESGDDEPGQPLTILGEGLQGSLGDAAPGAPFKFDDHRLELGALPCQRDRGVIGQAI